jgi:hypothetical protein
MAKHIAKITSRTRTMERTARRTRSVRREPGRHAATAISSKAA